MQCFECIDFLCLRFGLLQLFCHFYFYWVGIEKLVNRIVESKFIFKVKSVLQVLPFELCTVRSKTKWRSLKCGRWFMWALQLCSVENRRMQGTFHQHIIRHSPRSLQSLELKKSKWSRFATREPFQWLKTVISFTSASSVRLYTHQLHISHLAHRSGQLLQAHPSVTTVHVDCKN